MARSPEFIFERKSRDGGLLKLDGTVVGEIRRLELCNFRPRVNTEPLVGKVVGVPLYWRQYGDHQNPERRANSHRGISAITTGPRWLQLRARGLTRSRSVESVFIVTFRVDGHGRISCEVRSHLKVVSAQGWVVTPHPDHGEVTFCTLWPEGVFSPDGSVPKRFQSCLIQRGSKLERVEHHHLESPDKHHIRLRDGDRFGWVLEDVNPMITLGPGTSAEAGVCAYMWDVHFGLKICRDAKPVTLPQGTVLEAAYTLSAENKARLRPLVKRARVRSIGAAIDQPVWKGGRHNFQETFRSEGIDRNTAWPWQSAVTHGQKSAVRFTHDRRVGCNDAGSLKIENSRSAQSCWQATTLGPAFGEPAFRSGGRLRLRAMVRVEGSKCRARVLLRVHRQGKGSVFAVSDYELFPSEESGATDQDWRELVVTTPALKPAPDRVHVLLQLEGRGTAWFDEVELSRLR